MAVVPIDERGRITLPKGVAERGTKAVIIPSGSFVVVIPFPKEPLKETSSWLPSKRSRKELKELAEKLKEARERTKAKQL